MFLTPTIASGPPVDPRPVPGGYGGDDCRGRSDLGQVPSDRLDLCWSTAGGDLLGAGAGRCGTGAARCSDGARAPLLAAALQSLLPGSAPRIGRREVAGFGAAVAILAVVALLLPGSLGTTANVPNGRNLTLDRLHTYTVIFNDSVLGGWLLRAHPGLDPVIDGRFEAFTLAHFEGFIATSQVRAGWEGFLHTTDSNYALVEDQSSLAAALEERPHWRSLGTDDAYLLLAAP